MIKIHIKIYILIILYILYNVNIKIYILIMLYVPYNINIKMHIHIYILIYICISIFVVIIKNKRVKQVTDVATSKTFDVSSDSSIGNEPL